MKKFYYLFVALILGLNTTSMQAQRKDARILFVANLDGSQEVPAVSTKAKGLITVMLEEDGKLTINGVFDSLSGPATLCHFHLGDSKSAGKVIYDLTSGIKNGNSIYFKTPTRVPDSLISGILNAGVYLNVHTATSPGGEIRGIPIIESDTHYTAFLSAANEVPTNSSKGFGLLSMVVSKNLMTIEVKAVVYGLSSAIAASHFHFGAAGANGAVNVPLNYSGNVISGTYTVTQPFIDSLVAGKIYMNVHTSTSPGGEIRAQVTPIASNTIGFDALLEGANEIPATASDAKGVLVGTLNATLDTLSYSALYAGLSPLYGHIHDGTKDSTGAVINNFVADANYTNIYRGVFPLTLAQRLRLIKGSNYANIHTTASPGGEIRGQVYSSIREGLVSNLCAGQEPTPNASKGIGAAAISVNRLKTDVSVNLVTTGLTGNITVAHIHKGAIGANGPVYVPFVVNANNTIKGVYTLSTAGGGDSIINGQIYANVHTAANGGGEIRGQVDKILNTTCLTTGTFELNGKLFTVSVAPNPAQDLVNVSFDSDEKLATQLVVTDIAGRILISKDITVLNGSNQIGIKISDLFNGIYFIQLRNNNQLLFTEKIIKN